jgi:hypothetical protein
LWFLAALELSHSRFLLATLQTGNVVDLAFATRMGHQWDAQGDAAGAPEFNARRLLIGGLDAEEGGGLGGFLEFALPVVEGRDGAADGLAELGDGELAVIEVIEVFLPKESFVGIGWSGHGGWPVRE